MRNTLILLGLVSLLSTGTVFAQDADTVKRHTVELFMELDSGTLVNDTWGIFEGNFIESGLSYRYTINNYFSVYTKATLTGKTAWNNDNINDGTDKLINPDYKLNGIGGFSGGLAYLEFGMSFGKYGYIAMRQNMMIKAYAFAPFQIGQMHNITLLAGVEALPDFVGQKILPGTDEPGQASQHSLQVLAIGINYNVNFHAQWGFTTELQYRTSGAAEQGGTTGSTAPWDIDTMEALKINSSFRWDNTITYKPIAGSSIWFQVRYLPKNFIENESAKRNAAVTHDVYLRAGYTHSFNF